MDVQKLLHEAAKRIVSITLPAQVHIQNQVIKSKKQVKINAEKAIKEASLTAAEVSMWTGLSGQSQQAAQKGMEKIKRSPFTKGADSIGS